MIALLLLSLLMPTDWVPTLNAIEKQVVRLEAQEKDDSPGTCSAVVLAPGIAVTAGHCVEGRPDLTIHKNHAWVVQTNRILDLAVVKFVEDGEQPMIMAKKTPPMGTEIAIAGYGFGSKNLLAQFGRVSNPKDDDDYLVVNADVLFGDSGGAVIDAEGHLVGLTVAVRSEGPAHIGLAVPIEAIRSFVKEFVKNGN